jgi:ribosomal-protein-alanine N-acetyltransferase
MAVIETARLTLRPFTLLDVPDHARLYRDPEVTRYLGGGPVPPEDVPGRSRQVVEAFVAHWKDHGFGVWAVIDRASGRLIGQCGLKHLPESPEIEALYALERARWGGGLASEAAGAALHHGFTAVGLPRIVAVTRPDNHASRRVMEKLGMRYEGELLVYGGIRALCYAITREQYRARGGG